MSELIHEQVSVNFLSNHLKRTVCPTSVYWRGRRYVITKLGLHYTRREGRTLFHVFSVTNGNTFFKLQLDTETLHWKLMEIDDEENC